MLRRRSAGAGLLFQVCALCLLAPSAALADTDGCSNHDVEFDHAAPKAFFLPLQKADGSEIRICILNTRPGSFTYEISGLTLPPEEGARVAAPAGEEKQLTQRHDKQYGGYLVRIQAIGGAETKVTVKGQTVTLTDQQFIVGVQTVKWEYEVSGGFTMSRLPNPVFGLRPDDNSDDMVVFRDESKEDDVRLGVAGFIQLYHDKYPYLVPTFGLGINEGNTPTYYTGLSYRFGKSGAITAGAAFGSVDALPAGVQLNRPPADANALNNLRSRTDVGFFVALSYSFLKPSPDLFDKPIKGEEKKETPASTQPEPEKAKLALETGEPEIDKEQKKAQYKLAVKNSGAGDATAIKVTDDLGGGKLEIDGNRPPNTELDDGKLVWTIDKIQAGASADSTVMVRLKEGEDAAMIQTTAKIIEAPGASLEDPLKMITLDFTPATREPAPVPAPVAGLVPVILESSRAAVGGEIRQGMSPQEVEAAFGEPVSRHMRDDRLLYRYPQMVVAFRQQQVEDVVFWLGMRAAELLSLFGPPETKAVLGPRVVCQYPDLVVELTSGTVSKVRP